MFSTLILNCFIAHAICFAFCSPSPSMMENASRNASAFFERLRILISTNQNHSKTSFVKNQNGVKIAISNWRDLPGPRQIAGRQGAVYFDFKLLNGSRVHLLVLDLNSVDFILKPGLSPTTKTTTHQAELNSAAAAINGGFFSLADGTSVSYVIVDGKELASPRKNPGLVDNDRISSVRNKIYNRSEMRVLISDSGQTKVQIANHDEPVSPGFRLLHSLQAGPRLLPRMTLEEEAFIRKEAGGTVDVIRSSHELARTAFGVTPDNHVMLLCVEGGDESVNAGGASLSQVRQLMASLGCSEALNLDGGSSTSMYLVLPDPSGKNKGHTVCRNEPERRVKSVLLLFAAGQPWVKVKKSGSFSGR